MIKYSSVNTVVASKYDIGTGALAAENRPTNFVIGYSHERICWVQDAWHGRI